MSDRASRFPLGASIAVDTLQTDPYASLAALRTAEPVSWIPALNGWLITRRDLAVDAMRDSEGLTVDDPRFTTAAVLGASMLSLDGPEHRRHRSAFATSFRRSAVRSDIGPSLTNRARELVTAIAPLGRAELRSSLAGPMAVDTIIGFLGLSDVDASDVLAWYYDISAGIVDLTLGRPVQSGAKRAAREISERVASTLRQGNSPLLQAIEADGSLSADEIATETAVVMFGAIETSEGMTANLLWHLLSRPETLAEIRDDRDKLAGAVEESLRLEPAAAVIDRYATTDLSIGGVTIPAGDLVTISLLAANRDPDVFANPNEFVLGRDNVNQHVTFVQGPHACIGLHLARAETVAILEAVLDLLTDIELDVGASQGPEGLIFRKAPTVAAKWRTPKS